MLQGFGELDPVQVGMLAVAAQPWLESSGLTVLGVRRRYAWNWLCLPLRRTCAWSINLDAEEEGSGGSSQTSSARI